ncbi:unnamed protein product [Rotaria sp. Silwood2]|nr:unnamed protein product [Rotaria sp. Silwood2]CAF4043438.1 unnamed protein product [Rotaria sp. Silwood2]
MDQPIITRFEDLPVEILMEIFDYFKANEIYLLFYKLNNRLKSAIKSLPVLIFVKKRRLGPILSFFHSFKAVHVKISHFDIRTSYQPNKIYGGHRLLYTYSSTDYKWFPRRFHRIEKIILSDICSQLRSLILPASSSKLVQSIFRGEFSRLKICHLGKCDPFFISLSISTQLQSFRQLTMRGQKGSEFEKILLMCPSLIYCDFSCDDAIPPFTFINCCLSSMKYLRLTGVEGFLFHNGQFDFLLSLFPNLRQFHLAVEQCDKHLETIEFQKVADTLLHRLPSLKILDLRIQMTKFMTSEYVMMPLEEIAQMHPLFNYILVFFEYVMITSYGFVPNHFCTSRYARPYSE